MFYYTLTTLGAGLNIQNQGLMQARMFIASITYVLYLLLHQILHSNISCSNQYLVCVSPFNLTLQLVLLHLASFLFADKFFYDKYK